MKRTVWLIILATFLGGTPANGQVTLREVYFNEFITFFVSSVDVETGATDLEMFEMELTPLGGPISIRIEFSIRIDSAPLGLSYAEEFLSVVTDAFILEKPVRIRNTDLSTETDALFYEDGTTVPINIRDITTVDFEELESMQSNIIQTGRLPDGNYKFSVIIRDNSDAELARWERVITAAHPVALELITPGGLLEDTLNTAISTTYPFFQWESDLCAVCNYQIRVARFKRDEHSALEDAIEDQTVLPMEQALGFYEVGNITSFQYPTGDVIDLEPGLIYAWQVQKILPTTIGDEEILSPIFAFKIIDPTAASAPTTSSTAADEVAQSPVLQFLQTVMGEEEFQAVFSADGDLAGFTPNNVITLNNAEADFNSLNAITTGMGQGDISILSVEVQ